MNTHVSNSGEVYRLILVPALVFEYKGKQVYTRSFGIYAQFCNQKSQKAYAKSERKESRRDSA